jgi:5-methylcytosine-specific restriction endonuclease McrA
MSNQAFTPTFREALWKSHNKKCIHCRRELLFAELRVDHLLPEYLANAEAEREAVLQLVGLPPEFDILGKENLAPSCAGCNDQKGSTILEPGSLAILISKVRDKIAKVEEHEKSRQDAKELDGILRAVAASVESGKFSLQDLKRRLNDWGDSHDGGLTLNLSVGLEDNSRKLSVTSEVVEKLRRRRITLGEIVASIRSSLKHGDFKVDRRSVSAFMIRGRGGLNVTFEMWRNEVQVTNAYIA